MNYILLQQSCKKIRHLPLPLTELWQMPFVVSAGVDAVVAVAVLSEAGTHKRLVCIFNAVKAVCLSFWQEPIVANGYTPAHIGDIFLVGMTTDICGKVGLIPLAVKSDDIPGMTVVFEGTTGDIQLTAHDSIDVYEILAHARMSIVDGSGPCEVVVVPCTPLFAYAGFIGIVRQVLGHPVVEHDGLDAVRQGIIGHNLMSLLTPEVDVTTGGEVGVFGEYRIGDVLLVYGQALLRRHIIAFCNFFDAGRLFDVAQDGLVRNRVVCILGDIDFAVVDIEEHLKFHAIVKLRHEAEQAVVLAHQVELVVFGERGSPYIHPFFSIQTPRWSTRY